MLKTMLSVLLSGFVMVCAGPSAATPYEPYDRLAEKLHLTNISTEAQTAGSPLFLSAATTGKFATSVYTLVAETVAGNQEPVRSWDSKLTSLLNGRLPNDELEEAFTSVTANIIAPSIAKDGVLPANLLGLREIIRLMTSATAQLQVLDLKMAKFNLADQAGNVTSPVDRAGGGTAEKLRIVPQGSEQAGAAMGLFRDVKLYIAGNMMTFLPVGATVMVFVFFIFRRIEKHA